MCTVWESPSTGLRNTIFNTSVLLRWGFIYKWHILAVDLVLIKMNLCEYGPVLYCFFLEPCDQLDKEGLSTSGFGDENLIY